eukprot:CAMPEP_0169467178 /NCGR_PEP_ID=MMETSP1042-20121227/22190_1 /TAXON_ID=464988 /ORGANISM="Hemiselmis andersenii, Strain CCMP1180" /LENGTH=206 /DNA_ID=CAMNT_0009580335 /DNA_START=148 /DNA_END=765 /DNA_ORIENTATION=+
MSLKQFPAHGTFSRVKDDLDKQQNPKAPPPAPRTVATVFDVENAWDMLDRRQHYEGAKGIKDQAFATYSNVGKLNAARMAASSGIKVTKDFSVAQAIERFKVTKLREMAVYVAFIVCYSVAVLHLRAVPEREADCAAERAELVLAHRFVSSTDGNTKTFDRITSERDAWDWLRGTLPDIVFTGKLANLDPATTSIPVNTTCATTPG